MSRVEPMPIEYLEPNPFQYRTFTDDDLTDLIHSIKTHGFLGSLEARPANPDPQDQTRALDGRYQLVDGARRLEAAKRAGLTKLPIRRVWRDDEEMELLCYLTNSTIKPASYWEEANYFKRLQNHGWSMAKIAQAIGKPKAYVQMRLDIFRNDPEVLEAIAAGKIDLSLAAILPYFPEDTRKVFWEKVKAGKATYADLKAHRKAVNLQASHAAEETLTVIAPRDQEEVIPQEPAVNGHEEAAPEPLPEPVYRLERTTFAEKTGADHARLLLVQVKAVVENLEARLRQADLMALADDERNALRDYAARLRSIALALA